MWLKALFALFTTLNYEGAILTWSIKRSGNDNIGSYVAKPKVKGVFIHTGWGAGEVKFGVRFEHWSDSKALRKFLES